MVNDGDGQEREKKRDPFTPEGEALAYVSLDQARVLAIQHARENTSFYGPPYADQELLVELVSAEEGEDYYHIRLSYRPALRFSGEPGIEQISVGKAGSIALRQIVSEPRPRRRVSLSFAASGLIVVAAIAVSLLFVLGVLPQIGSDTRVVEVVKEVPVEKEVIKEVMVEVPGETVVVEKEVIREVEVPGETVVVEKVVVKEVEVPVERLVTVEKEVIKEVPVEKIVVVEKEVIREVEVAGETVVVEKEVIREVEVPGETVVVVKEVIKEVVVQATPTVPGGTLRVTSQASIGTLDQVWTTAYVTAAVAVHMHERMFEWDEDLFPKPQVLESWDVSGDGKTYTFTTRDNLTFHDGAEVTSDDAIASLKRQMEGSHWAPNVMVDFAQDPPFQKVDKKTFQLLLADPFGQVVGTFSAPWGGGPILPKKLADTPASEKLTEFTGSGSYELEKWEVGHQIVLKRYEDYVPRDEPGSYLAGAQNAYSDRIIWLEVPDEETKMAGLETGEWDIVDGASLDFFKRARINPDLTVRVYKPGHRSVLVFNQIDPPFVNQKVRQALQAGLNIAAIMAAMGDSELWGLCPALFHCGTPLESDVGADLYNENDPVRAQQLLDDSGYTGEPIVFLSPNDYATITPIGLATKPLLEEMGFTVEFPTYDWATLVTRLRFKENWNLFTSWIAHWSEGGDPLRVGFLFPEGGPANPQHGGYKDLILEYATALDLTAKRAAIDKIQALWYEDVPMIYLGTWFSIFPASRDVKNFDVVAFPVYSNVWLDR